MEHPNTQTHSLTHWQTGALIERLELIFLGTSALKQLNWLSSWGMRIYSYDLNVYPLCSMSIATKVRQVMQSVEPFWSLFYFALFRCLTQFFHPCIIFFINYLPMFLINSKFIRSQVYFEWWFVLIIKIYLHIIIGYTCPEDRFTCYNYTSAGGGPKCLAKTYICDGNPYYEDYKSCKNGEDEKDCSSKNIIYVTFLHDQYTH